MEVPAGLLVCLQPGPRLGAESRATGRGSFIVAGMLVTDVEALSQMDIPGHETSGEVAKVEEDDADGATTGEGV